ncbi:MAG TPA: histidine kinase [Solirubrobacteraceae bacterium]|jgi:signal transduction histidine kinase
MTALRGPLAGPDRRRLDLLLAIAIAIALELEVWLDPDIPASLRPLTAVAAVLFAAPVAVRRPWPAPALLSCTAVAAIQALLGGELRATSGIPMMLALVVLTYSVGARLELRRSVASLILGFAIFSGFVFDGPTGSGGGVGAAAFFVTLVFAAPWCLGRLAREHDRRTAVFRELADQTVAEQAERDSAVIAQERIRIGSELQDIITHNVSAMVIGAGGARKLLHADPERARRSILTVEQTGREALGDLRRLLGMLRKEDDPRALAPQPGLDQLITLLDSLGAEGLDCSVAIEGEPCPLTPGVDLVSYRVIEAALRSAASHQCGKASVTVHYTLDRLELRVRGQDAIPELGRELQRISERVALYGGSVRMVPGDGFAVTAGLPLANTFQA